jgi:prolyl oligopeptidase
MHERYRFAGAACALCVSTVALAAEVAFFPPATPVLPVVETLHGITLTDRYRWLENGKSADVEAWTQQQHAATRAWLDRNAPAVPGLKDELTRLIDRDVTQPPFFKKGHEFFLRTLQGESQAKFYTRIAGRDVLLFDPTKLDPSGNTALGSIVPNREGTKAAVATYAKGSEISDFRVIDTTTGAQIGPLLPGVRSFAWARDEQFAYVSPRTAESIARQEPQRCYRHRLGGDRGQDVLLIAMDDAKDYCAVFEPEDADVTVFETGSFWANTIRIRPIGATVEPRTIWSSSKFRARATFRRDRIYFRTNDNAPNWKLMGASYDRPAAADWQVLVAEGDTVLEGFDVTSQWIVVRDKKDVLSRMFVHDLAGKRLRELPVPELGNVTAMAYDLDRDVIHTTIASFTAPRKVWTIDGRSLEFALLWQDNPPVDTKAIVAEQRFVTAKDGATIPVFIVHRKDWKTDGNSPVYLYGYGGFNIGIEPYFINTLASFVNRGGVFVDAGIRGGNEYGERWHEQGMLGSKQKSFDDFIAVAEWLVRERITNPKRMAIGGGSNGGLLVGAVLTQRPDLFRAAICGVPLLDMVRFHKFLIARYWITEYGDPDKSDDFRWLLRYSPYHNVRQGIDLPATLVTAGEYDSRVDPLHAKKFVAAVQNNPGQSSPFLLYMDFDSGHGYGKARAKVIEDRDFQLRFLMNQLGMNDAARTVAQ